MTKKDYDLIASVLNREYRHTYNESVYAGTQGDTSVEMNYAQRQIEVDLIAKRLVPKFKEDNSRFNESKWFAAIRRD